MLAAVERLPEHLDGPAAIADALCNALGVDVPVKRAAWEEAYEAWRGQLGAANSKAGWQAAVEWCVEQIAVVSCGPKTTGEIITRRIWDRSNSHERPRCD
jgi:hypothetical protein